MKKWRVVMVPVTSITVGVYEAESGEEAMSMAIKDKSFVGPVDDHDYEWDVFEEDGWNED